MKPQEACAELLSIRKNREDGYLTHLSYGGKADKQEEYMIEAYSVAINALEKQIPKKPTNYSIDNNGYMIYDCECPTCKCSHREYYPFAYCSHCGQALDWSDSE